MSNPYPRAERYRHVAIERLDGWVHSWWVCAHERRLCGVADLRLAASAALRIRHGARAACKRLRARVAGLEDRLDFAGNGWNKALEERDAARLELRALEWLTFESARQSFSFGFEERATGRVVWVSRPGNWPPEESTTYAAAARALGWEG